MNGLPQNSKKNFVGVDEEAMKNIAAFGVPPDMIEPLRVEFGKLAIDNVTGFHEGRSGDSRISTLHSAIHHVKETGQQAFYVEMDLQNLSGLNTKLGHTEANEVYKRIAAIIRSKLSVIASQAVFFRHGGDEMSAFLIETTREIVQAAMKTVQSLVQTLAKDCKLDTIPHSKHPDEIQWRGIGVHFGVCRLTPEHEKDPMLVFREADSALEEMKIRKLGATVIDEPESLL
jgi:diguanylate cyclase (GGDEF)-like protein